MSSMTKSRHIFRSVLIALAVMLLVFLSLIFVAVGAANAGGRLQESDSFGIGNERFSIDAPVGVISNSEFEDANSFESSHTALATYSTRDISTALSAISYKIELAVQARAEVEKADELAKINIAKNKRNDYSRQFGMPPGLEEINWDAGKDAFIAEWGMRINRYFLGTPLENMGEIFARAAWDNGIDPRWSAAISNTESSKGLYCFEPHNAWGWGDSSWSNWEDAIYGHVSGLAAGYGYTISKSYARTYCPPNSDHWYSATLSEMRSI